MGHRPNSGVDRGQTLPFAVLVLAVAALGLVLVVRTAAVAADRAHAQSAADAAALAGAAGGRAAAERLAIANDCILERYERRGDVVTVQVRSGEARATASARRSFERCVAGDRCAAGTGRRLAP